MHLPWLTIFSFISMVVGILLSCWNVWDRVRDSKRNYDTYIVRKNELEKAAEAESHQVAENIKKLAKLQYQYNQLLHALRAVYYHIIYNDCHTIKRHFEQEEALGIMDHTISSFQSRDLGILIQNYEKNLGDGAEDLVQLYKQTIEGVRIASDAVTFSENSHAYGKGDD